jgi:hypothetical protein
MVTFPIKTPNRIQLDKITGGDVQATRLLEDLFTLAGAATPAGLAEVQTGLATTQTDVTAAQGDITANTANIATNTSNIGILQAAVLTPIPAYSVKANAGGSPAVPTQVSLAPSQLLGRASGNVTGLDVGAGLTIASGALAAVPDVFWIRQGADYTLTNSTALQRLFDASATGALSLAVGQYAFEAMVIIDTMSATAGNGAWSLIGAGTATLAEVMQLHGGKDNTTPSALGAVNLAGIVTAATTGAWGSTGTGTAFVGIVRGSFKVTAAGTITPSIALDTAAAAVVKTGSFMTVTRLGSNAAQFYGWS